MTWAKRGFLYQPDPAIGQITHAQMPRGIEYEGRLRVYFSSRNEQGYSLPYWAEFDIDTMQMVNRSEKPIAELGQRGAFDCHGVMPCQIIPTNHGWHDIAYIGWQRTVDAPYRTAIGCLRMEPYTDKFFRDQNEYRSAPMGINSTFESVTLRQTLDSHYTDWMLQDPVFNIPDIEHLHTDSCTCSPCVIRDGDGNHVMYYSQRKREAFRRHAPSSYRIRKATLLGGEWMATDPNIQCGVIGSPDDFMQCYADVLYLNGRYIMLYNGNEFGRNGILWAESAVI